jgi:hypothetical protein
VDAVQLALFMGCGASIVTEDSALAHQTTAKGEHAHAYRFATDSEALTATNEHHGLKFVTEACPIHQHAVALGIDGQSTVFAAAVQDHPHPAAPPACQCDAIAANGTEETVRQAATISHAAALARLKPSPIRTTTSVAHNFEISQLDVCMQPPPQDYVSTLSAVVENMSGGQQRSEASYALGAGGGTKQDSKDEKAFSEILKGSAGQEGVRMPPVPPHKGVWLRILNRASGVYLYVNTETQRVVCML